MTISKKQLTLHTGSSDSALNYNISSSLSGKIATVSIDQWINLPPVPDQRNEAMRISKMKKAFIQQHQSLRNVAVALVERSFNITDGNSEILATVNPGIYRLDGNTRALFWKLYPEYRVEEPLIVTVFKVNSQVELELEYRAHDNKLAVENGSDLITGAFRKIGLSFSNKILQSGRISTALKYAYPGGREASILDMAYYYKDELSILDRFKLLEMSKDVFTQHIVCVMLIGLKYWDGVEKQRLIDGLVEFSKIVDSKTPEHRIPEGGKKMSYYESFNKMNPLAILWYEFSRTSGEKQHLGDMSRSTKFADMQKQLDFAMYLIDRYVNSKTLSYNLGINGTNHEGVYTEFLTDLSERN